VFSARTPQPRVNRGTPTGAASRFGGEQTDKSASKRE
jgi:hypothetical protein